MLSVPSGGHFVVACRASGRGTLLLSWNNRGGSWKRAHGSRIEARCGKRRRSHRTLPAARQLSTLPESGGRKRTHGCRTAARRESAGQATEPLPATRLPSTLHECCRYPYFGQGSRGWLRLHEKGGKRHDVPVHHRAAAGIDTYVEAGGLEEPKAALFQSVDPAGRRLTGRALERRVVLAMIKRRAAAAGLPPSTCCHTFRATGITAYLSNGGTLEHAQQIAAHASPIRRQSSTTGRRTP